MNTADLDPSAKTIALGGFGAKLARAREERQLSIAQVAAQLKLTVRQVEAIEAEDFARLPGPVFTRGFIRNYARLVGLDPEELLTATDARPAPTETITAPSEEVRLGGSPLGRWLLMPLLLFGLFLLMVSGVYYWLSWGEGTLINPPSADAPPGPSASTPLETLPAPSPTPAGTELPVQERTAPMETPPPAPQVEIPASTAPATDSASQPQSAGPAVLHFYAEEDAWIRVDDRAGLRYSKLLRAGTSEQVSGNPPFRLVIGNAAAVRLEYNQQWIDLKPFIGERVARLTLE